MATDRKELKKIVHELKSVRGRHTELVSVYVPHDYDLIKIIQHLEQEQGTASNIKDARTRNNVVDSLERAIRALRNYKQTPPNGLAVFAGNASEREGTVDIHVWVVEPPDPVSTRIYKCDQKFHTIILENMMDDDSVYGLIVLDKSEAHLGLLKGTSIEELQEFHSNVPGKTRAGGQSAQRFARIRRELTKEFYKIVADATLMFLDIKNLKGILVGGPMVTKDQFVDSGYINDQVVRKIIGTRDLSYTNEYGFYELVEKSEDLLKDEKIVREKKLVNEFLNHLAKDDQMAVYGMAEVIKYLNNGVVEKIIISDACTEEEIYNLETLAQKFSTKTFIISTKSPEGEQLRDLGKVAGILRYAVQL